MRRVVAWAPAFLFAIGSILVAGLDLPRHLELRGDLAAAIPGSLLGLEGTAMELPQAEIDEAGMDVFLLRSYMTPTSPDTGGADLAAAPFTLYVGFYGSQARGRTIHSPKNCLPGAGWEVLNARRTTVRAAGTAVPVNRYLLQRGEQRALVLYWYQGRGRVEADEYRVKLDLLVDAALRQRSDEALVRIVVPVRTTEAAAFEAAARAAGEVIPALDRVLPA